MKSRIFQVSSTLWINGFTIGLTYFCISSLSTLIGADLGYSDAQLSILFSLPTFMFVVCGWFPGLVVDRIGVRISTPVVFIFVWIPALLKLFVSSYFLFAALTVAQSLGIMLLMPTVTKGVKLLDPPQSARVLGLVNTGMSIGTFATHTFALSIARQLSDSWKNAVVVFLLVTLALEVISLPLFYSVKPPLPSGRENVRDASKGVGLFAESSENKAILIGLSVMFFGSFGISFALNNWLPKLLTYNGFTAESSAASASMYSLASLCASVVISLIFPRLAEKTKLAIPAIGTVTAALLLMLVVPGDLSARVLSFILGFVLGFLQFLVQFQIVCNSDPTNVGKYTSFLFCIGDLGATLSILGVGLIPETAYVGKILFIAAFAVPAIIGCIWMQKSAKTNV